MDEMTTPAQDARTPRIGLLYQMWELPSVTTSDVVDRCTEEFALAADLGYSSVWIGEHHFVRPTRAFAGRVPAPEVFIAHVAARVPGITFGTGVKILTESSAVRAAEEMSLLDLLCHGRVEFGVGQGATGGKGEEERARRQQVYRDRLDDILRLVAADTSTGLPVLNVGPRPQLAERIWAACRDDASVEHAAQHGLNYVVGQAENPHSQAKLVRRYREAGGTGRVRGVRAVHVAESRETALAGFLDAFEVYESPEGISGHHGDRYTRDAVAAGFLPARPTTLDGRLHQANIVLGTPDDVAKQLLEYVEVTGVDELDLLVQFAGLDAGRTRRTLELFAAEVRPRLGSLAGRG
ncbi:hypothetical protein BJF78_00755 [Pseudonocardia sp. CNS-139]|nr:hypothetical protein BJF78_00755 [Pseudonocardia sp. CNS-139]